MSNPIPFSSLDLKPALLSNLADIGYTEMTLVQAETLPQLIGGADVLARAKTGSGKTAVLKGAGFICQGNATRQLFRPHRTWLRQMWRITPFSHPCSAASGC